MDKRGLKARRASGRRERPLARPAVPGRGQAHIASAVALPRPPAASEAPEQRPAWADGRERWAERDGAIAVGTPATETAAVRERRITVETALYGLILVLAVVSRFWDLGSRALHHDESLHAYYSWLYATTGVYIHDPLMHGPFLFHVTALVYLLLGATDATTRITPALFGVALVGLPYLLRGPRHLGRWGALAASALLLVSPTLLYYSRYLRHDIYTVVGTLLLFACIVRYVERPERRWLVTGGVTLALLFTNHEVIFVIVFAFAIFLWGALLWGRLRPLVPLQIGALALAALAYLGIPRLFDSHLPAIPWENPTYHNDLRFTWALVTNPLMLALALIAVAFVVSAGFILTGRRAGDEPGTGWMPYLFRQARPGSVEFGLFQVWRDRPGLLLAIAIGAILFILLFTSLFTNLAGLNSGTFGALFYWLGQQNVRRGDQPWFYYLVLMPQYEFVAVVFGGAAALLTLWRAGLAAFGKRAAPPRLFFRLFLVVWFAIVFAVLSWAGEKMPWLLTHITLPATLLAAGLIGELIERLGSARAATRPAQRWVEPGLIAALLVAGGGWLLLAGHLSYGQFVETNGSWQRVVTSSARAHWWLLAMPPLAALLLLLASWLWRGARQTARPLMIALALGLVLLQIHGAFRMTYEQGDVPYDMLIYVQTSPDVTRMMGELTTLSEELTGGKGLNIWYDDHTAWPLQWYLRDFPNKHYFGTSLSAAPTDAPVLIVADDEKDAVAPYMSGYSAQEYVLRWWFPEDQTYRQFAIAPELPPGWSAWQDPTQPHGPLAVVKSIGSSLATQFTIKGQDRLYRLLMYRDLPAPMGEYTYTIYVRNDLVPMLNQIRYP